MNRLSHKLIHVMETQKRTWQRENSTSQVLRYPLGRGPNHGIYYWTENKGPAMGAPCGCHTGTYRERAVADSNRGAIAMAKHLQTPSRFGKYLHWGMLQDRKDLRFGPRSISRNQSRRA